MFQRNFPSRYLALKALAKRHGVDQKTAATWKKPPAVKDSDPAEGCALNGAEP